VLGTNQQAGGAARGAFSTCVLDPAQADTRREEIDFALKKYLDMNRLPCAPWPPAASF